MPSDDVCMHAWPCSYVQQREQFGTPLSAFPTTQEKLARMAGSIQVGSKHDIHNTYMLTHLICQCCLSVHMWPALVLTSTVRVSTVHVPVCVCQCLCRSLFGMLPGIQTSFLHERVQGTQNLAFC